MTTRWRPCGQGVSILVDEITSAKTGKIIITGVLLAAFKVTRTDGWARIQTYSTSRRPDEHVRGGSLLRSRDRRPVVAAPSLEGLPSARVRLLEGGV